MRYRDNREQSAELLRMVLPLMSRHAAAFHPLSYAVWYEYAAGVNQALRAAIDARTAQGQQLGDTDIQELFDAHVAMRDIESTMKLRARIQEVVEEVGEATSIASEEMDRYSAGLSAAQQKMQEDGEATQLVAVMHDIQADTTRVLDRTVILKEALKATSAEARRLGAELDTVRGQAQVDPLTSLLNSRGLERSIVGSYPRGLPDGVLLRVDVDRLAELVSHHGHLLGDRVLVAVAHVIVAAGGITAVIARQGGGEFVLLLPGATPGVAAEVGERLRVGAGKCRIRRPDGEALAESISVSIGLAPVSAGETLATSLARGEQAVARARSEGGNRIAVLASAATGGG